MSLDYVKKGESVKASTLNSIIDAIGGNQRMSPDLNVTTTTRGPQVSLPSNYGGPNTPLKHYLDTGVYMLSDWQYVNLVLGPTLDHCLDIFKFHDTEGNVINPISAAMIFKNSASSPIAPDTLSGYLLSDDQFGLDREAGASGWFQTPIEYTNGQNPVNAQLWSWDKPEGMVAVFTNVKDQLSVQTQLSDLLSNGGIESEKLNQLNMIGSWNLTDATLLSSNVDGEAVWHKTHQLVRVHDDIDIWDYEPTTTKHVNTASLVCYFKDTHKDEESGEEVLDNAKFAWKYWLGPDSKYVEGQSIKFVFSNGWTINGQPAVFKVEEEITDIGLHQGGTTAIKDPRGGYSILYGEFESNANDASEEDKGKIKAGDLFVNFNYYESYACMLGELGNNNNTTKYDLSRTLFLAKQNDAYKVKGTDDVSVGFEIPKIYFTYGTWSAVDKDWPLTDVMCPENHDETLKSKKSIEWKDNKPNQGNKEPVVETGVKSVQLYKFSEVVKSKCDMLSSIQLSDQLLFVVRREDGDGNAWVDYLNLDDLAACQVDSNISALYLSSIQEMTYRDPELSNDIIYHQLFNFDDDPIEFDFKNTDKFDIVVRDKLNVAQGAVINYIPLSSLTSALYTTDVDTDHTPSQKSIEWSSDANGKYLQLYKMDEIGLSPFNSDITANGKREHLLPNEYEFVLRKNGAGGEITYGKVDLSVQMGDLSGDSQVLPNQKSIECISKNGEDYIQLYNMDKVGTSLPKKTITLSADGYTPLLPSNYEFVLRQNGAGGTIKYANLSCCIPNLSSLSSTTVEVDSEVIGIRKSLDLIISPDLDPYYQLHNFQTSAVNGPDTLIKFQDQPSPGEDFSIGCNTEFVVRVPDGNDGYEVKYMQLSAYQEHERVDSRQQNTRGYSLDYTPYYAGTQYDVLQLYGFDAGCSYFITSADISGVYGNSILIRKWNEYGCCWQLDYMNFNSLDELAVKYIGDSQLSLSAHNPYSKSTTVLWDEYDQKKYVELYGFKSDFEFETVTIHNDGCTYYWPQGIRTDKQLDEFDYTLVKHVDSNGNISLRYTQLQVQMPDIESLEKDINGIYNDINQINVDIQYLSGYIDILSGELSATGWESGGDSSTCYGSNIGNNNGNIVIDLDETTLSGSWKTTQDFTTGGNLSVGTDLSVGNWGYFGGYSYAGCGFCTGTAYFTRVGAYLEGPVTIANDFAFNVGCAYLNQGTLQVGCNIRIGNTTLTESQLSALLTLI